MIILGSGFLFFGGLMVRTINNSPGFEIPGWQHFDIDVVHSKDIKNGEQEGLDET